MSRTNDLRSDDGGPAFPATEERYTGTQACVAIRHPGMSLRDWFAGQALVGILANDSSGIALEQFRFDLRARAAYAASDALLTERAKRKEKS